MQRPKVSDLTVREKIGQVLMISQGVLFTKDDGSCRTNEEAYELMSKYQFGGMWTAGGIAMDVVNVGDWSADAVLGTLEDSRVFMEKLQKTVKIPMFIGVDCERGTGDNYSDGTTTLGALSVGAANDEKLTYELNAAVAREVKAAGANWRWFPVVDLNSRFSSHLMRNFSDDIDRMSRHAIAAMRGVQSEDVVSTAKHFPGIDPYEYRDSHMVTTIINLSVDEWRKTQAKTFQAMIDAGVMSIMSSHIAFPAADDEMINGRYIPATASSKILKGLLRDEMGFEGVLITDALCMGGMSTMFSRQDMIIRAFNAGNDILLDVRFNDVELFYEAVCDGRIPMERLDESCERVLAMKEKIGLFGEKKAPGDSATICKQTREINQKVAEKSMTLLYDRNEMLPLSKEKIKKVAIICSSHFPAFRDMLSVTEEEFNKRGAEVTLVDDIPSGKVLKALAEEYDLLIYAGYVAPHRPMGFPSLYGDKALTYVFAFSAGKEKSLGVSMGYPFLHHDIMQGAETFINTYSPDAESQMAFVKALYGEIAFNTDSPVDVKPKMRQFYC